MSDTQLPGIFGDMQPMLEHYGYLGVAGMLFLEDFGVPVPGEIMLIAAAVFAGAGEHLVEIYGEFERYKWYVVGALVIVVAIVIAHRVRRRRAARVT